MPRGPLSLQLAASAIVLCAVASLAGCHKPENPNKGLSAPVEHLAGWTGATANLAPNSPPGEWRSEGRDYANTRYSPLTQINAANVVGFAILWAAQFFVLDKISFKPHHLPTIIHHHHDAAHADVDAAMADGEAVASVGNEPRSR